MAEKNTFWIDRRVADYENGYPASEAAYPSKEEYVEALEKLIDSLSEALSEAV